MAAQLIMNNTREKHNDKIKTYIKKIYGDDMYEKIYIKKNASLMHKLLKKDEKLVELVNYLKTL